ncbi:MAG: FtsX-like permease family protein [Actinomycetota bacterium]|nr:FtsX-like permease family protein [Actinomycetota bacterium]
MTWRDASVLAVKNLRRRFGHSILTVLAVALAATLLTALVTIAGTARTRVLKQLADGGPLAGIKVAAAEPDPSQVDNDDARPGRPKDLDEAARTRIARLPGVGSVVPIVSSQMRVVVPDPPVMADVLARLPPPTPTTVDPAAPAPGPGAAPTGPGGIRAPGPFGETLVGVDLGRADQLPITVLAGRLVAAGSLVEVDVTQGYLERLGLNKKQAAAVVGTEITMGAPRIFESDGEPRFRGRWVKAKVVGVVAQEASPGQLLGSIEAARQAREWTAAGGTGDGRLEIPTSPYSGLFVVARGIDQITGVRRAITDVGFATTAPENLIASVQRYLRVVEIVLGAIGFIALVIASLGITNALFAAVRERRREIGVLKAIGARDRDVMRVFLLDASVLGFTGGVLGTAAGFATAFGVSQIVNRYLADQGLAGVTLGLPVPVVIASIFGSTLLALGAGAFPARRAAHLPARDAMEAA